jgi:hypothetical protein
VTPASASTRQRSRRKVLVASTVAGLAGLTGGMAMASGRTPTTTVTRTAATAGPAATNLPTASAGTPATDDGGSSSAGPVLRFDDGDDAYAGTDRRGNRSALPPSGLSRPSAPSTSSQGS